MSFFFSSRRRHTRCSRDWSSDVCSSDLTRLGMVDRAALQIATVRDPHHHRAREGVAGAPRSEERRVGKECRYRGATDPEKNKKSTEAPRYWHRTNTTARGMARAPRAPTR